MAKVNTGQRAAFALSIFLARNRTVSNTPPTLLIDDPIAHINDLNALSFMNDLRDLVVNFERQIIIAKANTKVTSPFAKKFSFLEGEFQNVELTREAGHVGAGAET